MVVSTPHLGPLYPMPPVEYKEAELLVATYELPEESLEAILPSGLEAGPLPLAAIVMARYPKTSIGPYMESIGLVQARRNDVTGLYVAFIYVTTDVALCQGREVWGFPKKLAEIRLDIGSETARALLRRKKSTLEVSGTLDPTVIVSTDVLLSFFDLPLLNLKRIPRADAKGFDVDVFTAAQVVYDVRRASQGAAVLKVEGTSEDPLERVVPEGSEAVLFHIRCDMTLMPGRVV